MFVIYAPYHSNRLEYVLKHIFNNNFCVPYIFTMDKSEYSSAEGYKINYSKERIADGELFIESCCTLLTENNIRVFVPPLYGADKDVLLFPSSKQSDLPHDIFAAVFYMLSRYEEYVPFIKDVHGRFKAEESFAHKNNFLHIPLVDVWIENFKNKIEKTFNIHIKTPSDYRFIPTIDVDVAYAYRSKGVYRSTFGYLRSLSQGHFSEIAERFKINMGISKDPYDTFDYILKLHEKYNLKTIFFVLVGDYSTYDKNAPYKDSRFRALIRHLADYAEIGIHPSYLAAQSSKRLGDEIERLSEIIRKDVTISRQHYLRLALPNTYRYLVEHNIKEDYTMGFASEIGFRAGTSKPFMFYDLDADAPAKLRLNPLSIMEGTLSDYKNLQAGDASDIIKTQIQKVKLVNGHFISLFHNETLSNKGKWEGWQEVYEDMIKTAL